MIQASRLQREFGFKVKSASSGYVSTFIRLMAITDDNLNAATMQLTAVFVVALTSLYFFVRWSKERKRLEYERLIKAEKEGRRDNPERSALLRRIDETAREEKVRDATHRYTRINDNHCSNSRVGSQEARDEYEENESSAHVPTVSVLAYATIFPSLQASRSLLQTLKSNMISAEHSHLLPSILKNLLTGDVKYFKVNVQKDRPFYKHVFRYKCFRELLENLGFESGDEVGYINYPHPLSARNASFISMAWEEVRSEEAVRSERRLHFIP